VRANGDGSCRRSPAFLSLACSDERYGYARRHVDAGLPKYFTAQLLTDQLKVSRNLRLNISLLHTLNQARAMVVRWLCDGVEVRKGSARQGPARMQAAVDVLAAQKNIPRFEVDKSMKLTLVSLRDLTAFIAGLNFPWSVDLRLRRRFQGNEQGRDAWISSCLGVLVVSFCEKRKDIYEHSAGTLLIY
jgi:hypothetical protein